MLTLEGKSPGTNRRLSPLDHRIHRHRGRLYPETDKHEEGTFLFWFLNVKLLTKRLEAGGNEIKKTFLLASLKLTEHLFVKICTKTRDKSRQTAAGSVRPLSLWSEIMSFGGRVLHRFERLEER